MEEGKPVCLLTDFVAGGNLESKYSDPNFQIDWSFILMVAKGICAGMHHLHEEGLLHRDLAARNILLTASLEPMVADFGLSKKVDKLSTSKDSAVRETEFFQGPYKWMAPESLTQNIFSKKTDVWSYGVTLWEIMARSLPFPELDIYTAADMVCKQGLRLPLSPNWPPKWQQLLTSCWNVNADQRPGFVEISASLDAIEAEMAAFAGQ
jgi:serine/threonine protein kinase